MNLTFVASWIAIGFLSGVSIFQLAIMAGAPLGEYAFGGQNKGKLPRNLRIGSAITTVLYLALIGHFLGQIGILPRLLDSQLNSVANWAVVGLFSIALIMNTITRSKKERAIWAPVSLVLVAASIVIALG